MYQYDTRLFISKVLLAVTELSEEILTIYKY